MRSARYRILRSYKDTPHGPSDRIRTCGILLPKQARYQLRYTRIFIFCRRDLPGTVLANGSAAIHAIWHTAAAKTWHSRLRCIFGPATEHPVYGPAAARRTGGTVNILYRRLPFSSILCYNKGSFKKYTAPARADARRVCRRLCL